VGKKKLRISSEIPSISFAEKIQGRYSESKVEESESEAQGIHYCEDISAILPKPRVFLCRIIHGLKWNWKYDNVKCSAYNILKKIRTHSSETPVHGGEDAEDVMSYRSLFAKEPLITWLFSGKWRIKIRHPVGLRHRVCLYMGWLRLVGSLKLQVSFAKEPYQRDYILQKRSMILRSLLIVATPYQSFSQ